MLIAHYSITIISVLTSAGFAIAGLVRPAFVAPGQPPEASRIFALYTFARAIPVALVTVAAALGPGGCRAVAQCPRRADPIGRRLCRNAAKELPHDVGTHRYGGGAVRSASVGWSSALPERRLAQRP